MRIPKSVITLAVLMASVVAAYASPIFGTWRGEWNGKPITVTVTYNGGHTDVSMMSDTQMLAVSNAAFPKGGPPTQLHFQAANQSGRTKLVSTAGNDLNFELQTSDGRESVLRIIDQGKAIATVKMTKIASAK